MATLDADDLSNIAILSYKTKFMNYAGNTNNVFSRTQGSFTGSIDIGSLSYANFIAGTDATYQRKCTLNSDNTMTNTTNIASSGEVLTIYPVSFNALSNVYVNFYDGNYNTNKTIYIPSGLNVTTYFYPSNDGGLYRRESNSTLTLVGNSSILKATEMIPTVNWDRISQPLVINQPIISSTSVTKMMIIKDRTIDFQFDLHRNITGDTIYFGLKNDRKVDYYEFDIITCTIDDAINGLISLTIPETATQNLEPSKYYGELLRKTASGKYQTLALFEIDLVYGIISTLDI